LVRDKVTRLQNQGDEAIESATRDLRNRVSGVLANAVSMVSDENITEQVLEARIRSKMGLLARHGGDIHVSAQDGQIILDGNALQSEVEGLLTGLRRMRGVRGIQNNLHLHREPGNITALQGEGTLLGSGQAQWSPSTRLLAGIGAGYLMVYGMARGGVIGFFARIASLVLGSRALSNMDLRSLTGAPGAGEAINVRKSINVNAPVDEVYGLWSNFEQFPRFMSNIEEIRDLGNGRSHWVVKGPVGSKVEFEAMVTQNVPNQVVAWETTPESQVKHSGQVRFKESNKGTQVNVNMNYSPPAGAAGHVVAKMFGKDPKTEMDADLARFKMLLEEGKTRAKNQRITRDQVLPVTGESRNRQSQMHSERQGQEPELDVEDQIIQDDEDRDNTMGGN
jgi:uncharacterized membrane protein